MRNYVIIYVTLSHRGEICCPRLLCIKVRVYCLPSLWMWNRILLFVIQFRSLFMLFCVNYAAYGCRLATETPQFVPTRA